MPSSTELESLLESQKLMLSVQKLFILVVSRFMLVLASNQPDQFDWAINDRLDDLIPFELPGETERLRMLKLYFSLFILSPPRVNWWKKPKYVYYIILFTHNFCMHSLI